MSRPPQDTPPRARRAAFATRDPGATRRRPLPWGWVIAAFVVGVLLFALALTRERRRQFFTVEPVAKPSAGTEYTPQPLPVPGVTPEGTAAEESTLPPARIEEPVAAPADVPTPQPVPVPVPSTQAPAPAPAPPPVLVAATPPQPISQPMPPYPADAQRLGLGGRVLVRVTVDASGRPGAMSVVESSRVAVLDRAALQGIRGWRFTPALTANGQPLTADVVVPVIFQPEQD